MFDKYIIKDQMDYVHNSKTQFYYCVHDDIDVEQLIFPKEGNNIIFLNENYTDYYYLLNKDSPTIDTSALMVKTNNILPEGNFDIAFISNGEDVSEENYERLKSLNLPNRLYRVDNVDGRNNAYKEAARKSNTRYFFAFFAKIEVNESFDFTFNTLPFDNRHYVFRSHNPINGLEYGHQGIILYNKKMVLENPGTSIDFTMAQLYREVPILSGIARYNYSPEATWRTAFREALKLVIATDQASKDKLHKWFTGRGNYAEYSIKGAKDAVRFYHNHLDDQDMLLKSYEWKWLTQYYSSMLE